MIFMIYLRDNFKRYDENNIKINIKKTQKKKSLRPASPQGIDRTVKPRPRGPRLEPYGSPPLTT